MCNLVVNVREKGEAGPAPTLHDRNQITTVQLHSHCTSRSERVRSHVRHPNAHAMEAEVADSLAHLRPYHRCRGVSGRGVREGKPGDGHGVVRNDGREKGYPSGEGRHRADGSSWQRVVMDRLASGAILLVADAKSDACGSQQKLQGRIVRNDCAIAIKGNVADTELHRSGASRRRRHRVFADPKEEEERNRREVGDLGLPGGAAAAQRPLLQPLDDRDWDSKLRLGRWIFAPIGFELALEL